MIRGEKESERGDGKGREGTGGREEWEGEGRERKEGKGREEAFRQLKIYDYTAAQFCTLN